MPRCCKRTYGADVIVCVLDCVKIQWGLKLAASKTVVGGQSHHVSIFRGTESVAEISVVGFDTVNGSGSSGVAHNSL